MNSTQALKLAWRIPQVFRSELGRLATKGGIAMVVKILGGACSFLMFVLLAQSMDSSEFGRLGFAFSAATFLAIVGSVGHFTLLLRFVPIYLDRRNGLKLRQLISYSLRTVGLGVFTTSALSIIAAWGYWGLTELPYAIATVILTASFVAADYLMSLLRSIGGVVNAIMPRILLWRFLMVIAGSLCVFFSIKLMAVEGLMLLSLSLLSIVVVQALYTKKMLAHSFKKIDIQTDVEELEFCNDIEDPMSYGTAQWQKAANWFWGVAITQAAMQNLGVVIFGLLLTPEETGKFFIVVRISMMLGMPLMAVTVVVPPLISKYYANKQFDAIQNLCSSMAGIASAVIALGLLFLVFFGTDVLEQFNSSFSDAYPALLVASCGILLDAAFGPTGYIMLMTGFEKKFMGIVAVSNLVAILMLCVLTYRFGTIGAATSLLFGAFLWNSITWLWCRKTLGIDPTVLGMFPFLRPPRLT